MIIADSNVIVARLISRDGHHAEATALLEKHPGEVFVTPSVLVEVSSVLRRNISDRAEAARLVGEVAETVGIASEAEETVKVAAALYEKRHGQLSLVDCLLACICRNRQATLLTFDEELKKAVGPT